MTRKFQLIAVLLAALVLVAGPVACSDSDTSAGMTNKEMVEKVATALADFASLDTLALKMDLTVNSHGREGGEAVDQSFSASMDMAIDKTRNNMKMTMFMQVPEEEVEPGMPSSFDMQMYVVDNVMYTNMVSILFGMGDTWVKADVTEEDADETQIMSPEEISPEEIVGELMDLLSGAVDFKIVGEEKVNGVNARKVSITPDEASFREMMEEQDLSGFASGEFELGDDFGSPDEYRDASLTLWIAKDTFLPVRMEAGATVVNTTADTDKNVDMEMNLWYSKFGEPVTIELPPEAKNAGSMEDMMGDLFGGMFEDMDWDTEPEWDMEDWEE